MRRKQSSLCLSLILAGAVCFTPSASAKDHVDSEKLFRDKVRTILVTRCVACHGGGIKLNADLDLTHQRSATEGGRNGPAIVPGKSADSLLYQHIIGKKSPMMPPKTPLNADEIALIKQWIDAGASYAGDSLDLWSLRPVKRPAVPNIRSGKSEIRTPVDAFIQAALIEKGLAPAPEADRRTLVRRVTFNLTGLPPTPEEMTAALNDSSADWYEKLVERLLASPAYGERWARHWLDVVRFADSMGYEMNNPRWNAWPYRDWVIRAFNKDIPYPQMILEQLAGDTVESADVLTQAATGFIVGGSTDTVFTALPKERLQRRMDDLDDMLSTASAAFLGLTVNCARCHNHKFDPIAQKDYYALQAIFAGVQHSEREIRSTSKRTATAEESKVRRELSRVERELDEHEPRANPKSMDANRPTVNHVCNVERLNRSREVRFIRFTIYATNDRREPCLDEIEVYTAEEYPRNVALAAHGTKVTVSSTAEGSNSVKSSHINDGKHGDTSTWISATQGEGTVTLELSKAERIDRILWGRDRNDRMRDRLPIDYQIEVASRPGVWEVIASSQDRRRYNPLGPPEPLIPPGLSDSDETKYRNLVERRKHLLQQLPSDGPTMYAYAGQFTQPGPTHVLMRGDPAKPGEKVAPGGVRAIKPSLVLSAVAPESERRAALAKWLAHPEHPLTARVMVNRVWQWHFGQGLVTTPSDFGYSGAPPSHPELLDWLADEFVRNGWSIKSLHRLIVLSATYRQSGKIDPKALNVDKTNRYLWRMTPRRIAAEELRDSQLAVNGRLDRRMGGRGYFLWGPSSNYVYEYRPKQKLEPDDYRRMIYEFKIRSQNDPTFGVFDCPDASLAKPKRTVSVTVLQALNLLNAEFALDQAESFAERLKREAGDSIERQVERAFQLAFARTPSKREATMCAEAIHAHGLSVMCRALFNASEFLYVD